MRCFVAIELPDAVRDRLIALQQQLQSLGRAVRWTRPEQMHLTVKFLGEVPEDQVAAVCEAAGAIAAQHPCFQLEIRGTGCFPPRGPIRVLWAGIPQLPQPLVDCQRTAEAVFQTMGFERENRPYSPHLTLGRVNDASASSRIREALKTGASFEAGPFTAEELVVFQSALRPTSSVYTPLTRAPFRR